MKLVIKEMDDEVERGTATSRGLHARVSLEYSAVIPATRVFL